jgi:ATP-dependent helicase HrpA
VFVEGQTIRNQAQFEAQLAAKKSSLVTVANQLGKQLAEIMADYQQLRLRLKQPAIAPVLRQDVEQQLALLLYSGFVRYTPMSQISAISRYLKAIVFRLEKQKPDNGDVQGLYRLSKHYWLSVEKQLKTQIPQPERDLFRWQLEELRVSLFAQQLKTPYPVSVQRLEKIWNER